MAEEKETEGYKKFINGLVGIVILVLGITFILIGWSDVISFFRGIIGITLAIAGLVVLYLLGGKK